MATIIERGGRYSAQIRLKGHPPVFGSFERRTDAKRWAAQTESAIREGRYFQTTEAKRHTLGEAIDRYAVEILPRKPKSAVIQRQQLEWWKERLGHLALADVTPPVIIEQRETIMRDTKAKSTANTNRYMAVLSHLFTIAMKEWAWVDDSPFRKIQRLKEPSGRIRFLDDNERMALLAACRENPNPNLYDAVVLALSTGCRKNEILRLTWADVNLERGQIRLMDTKNGTPRAVPLTGYALERMRERSRLRRIDTSYVFPYPNTPKPCDVDRDFARARDKAGIQNFRFHDLRHSAASYLAMGGASTSEIAAVLGHKTLAMVQRYAHLSEPHTAQVVTKMNRAIFAAPENKKEGAEA